MRMPDEGEKAGTRTRLTRSSGYLGDREKDDGYAWVILGSAGNLRIKMNFKMYTLTKLENRSWFVGGKSLKAQDHSTRLPS